MRISSSNITMAANRSYKAATTEDTTNITRYYAGKYTKTNISTATLKTSEFETEGSTSVFSSSAEGTARLDKNDISYKDVQTENADAARVPDNGQGAMQSLMTHLNNLNSAANTFDFEVEESPEIAMLRRMLELLNKGSGKKASQPAYKNEVAYKGIKNNTAFKAVSFGFSPTAVSLKAAAASAVSLDNGAAQNGRWTRQTVVSGFAAGEEHTAFSSVGSAVTSDGRTINFGVTLEMSRSFAAAYKIEGAEQEFVLTDPLVINLEDGSPEISDVSFYFDLDNDGVREEMSSLSNGSGFLALDKNGDGEINNGSELFGTRTGDGFAELSQYDDDGNGWIDENDAVFSRLSVWVKAGQSDAKLLALSEAGVGAIFLGSQKTQATLADSNGFEGAVVRSTGVFLKENGSAGTIQHIDFRT